jgi:hypothetical protein
MMRLVGRSMSRLPPPDEILRKDSPRRMRSKTWLCSTCREVVRFAEPVTVSAPCPRCGGITTFEVMREDDRGPCF